MKIFYKGLIAITFCQILFSGISAHAWGKPRSLPKAGIELNARPTSMRPYYSSTRLNIKSMEIESGEGDTVIYKRTSGYTNKFGVDVTYESYVIVGDKAAASAKLKSLNEVSTARGEEIWDIQHRVLEYQNAEGVLVEVNGFEVIQHKND